MLVCDELDQIVYLQIEDFFDVILKIPKDSDLSKFRLNLLSMSNYRIHNFLHHFNERIFNQICIGLGREFQIKTQKIN